MDRKQPPQRGVSPPAAVMGGAGRLGQGRRRAAGDRPRRILCEGVGTPGPRSPRTSQGSELTNAQVLRALGGVLTRVWAGREGLSSVAATVVASSPRRGVHGADLGHQCPHAGVHTLLTLGRGRSPQAWGRLDTERRRVGQTSTPALPALVAPHAQHIPSFGLLEENVNTTLNLTTLLAL